MNKVDQLGHLLAQAATISAQVKALKSELIECGEAKVEGDFFKVTVSHTQRNTLDMKAAKAKLSRQFIVANTKTTEVTTVRCVSR